MTSNRVSIDQAFANAESVGTIGSPSTTSEIRMDIRGAAAENKLVGEMAVFNYRQQNAAQYALGQITEVRLQNIMLEGHAMRTLTRQRGRVDHVSEAQDTHDGQLRVSAVYSEAQGSFRESSMGTVPPTGTDIKIATNDVVNEIIHDHLDNVFYLGTSYQSELDLPMWFRQFNGAPGQLPESVNIGIFGRTGSGKSVLAKLIMLAYASHQDMNILVIDPQGEFTRGLRGESETFDLNIQQRMKDLKKRVETFDVSNIVIDDDEIIKGLIAASRFLHDLDIRPRGSTTAHTDAADTIINSLVGIDKKDWNSQQSFTAALEALKNAAQANRIYRDSGRNSPVIEAIDKANAGGVYQNNWKPLMMLFDQSRQGSRTVRSIPWSMFSENSRGGRVISIDLSGQDRSNAGIEWSPEIQNVLIYEILNSIRIAAEKSYLEGRLCNTMVFIDEAHRLAPQRHPEGADRYARMITDRLVDASRTNRKYGLGWTFISQTLASIHPDITRQTRIKFFGHGLAMGSELQTLQDLVGGDRNDIRLYQSFRDPESSFSADTREYSFMLVGPVSPLCLTAAPLFLNVYNDPKTFLEKNRRVFPNWQPRME